MKKNVLKKIFVLFAVFIMTLCVAFSCKTSEGTGDNGTSDKPLYDSALLYEGYDSALRVDDTRRLSAPEYSIYNSVGRGDFENHEFDSTDGVKADKNRYVGMFYFMQQGQHDDHRPGAGDSFAWEGPFNTTNILEKYGQNKGFDGNFAHSPVNKAHWWGESVYGYYHAADPYVMRKNIEMLTFAGVDFLYLDCTNGFAYKNVTDVLFPIISEYRAAGWPAPQIVYYFNVEDRGLLRSSYVNYYTKSEYDNIWFMPDGKKPMTVINKTTLDDIKSSPTSTEAAMLEFFDFKSTVWPTQFAKQGANKTPIYIDPSSDTNGFPWLDFNWPQQIFRQTSGNGIINVSAGQHPTDAMSIPTSWGRGWTHTDNYTWNWPRPTPIGKGSNNHERYAENLNLQQQWDTVFKNDDKIEIVSVTGWNEWAAGKYKDSSHGYYTVDGFNDEYSRDLAPTKSGKMKDNAYLLNTALTRKWKNSEPKHYVYPLLSPKNIDDDVWSSASRFADFKGKSMKRNFMRTDGIGMLTDNTPRNIITDAYVARDEENLYFKIKCASIITQKEATDSNWMNIHINTRNNFAVDSLGYQFVVNKNVTGNKTDVLMADGATYKKMGEGDITVSGKTMLVKIPLKVMGLSERNCEIEFKISDNSTQNDILDFYATGDSAPCGRLNWKFGY